MKKSILKAISVLIVVVMAFSLFYTGGSSIVRAASEFKLTDKSDTLTLDYVINKSDGEKQIYPGTVTPTITYGDTLYVSLSWSFADSTILNVGDVLTYTLPSAIKFRDIESEITNDAGKVLGTFTLENNVIN